MNINNKVNKIKNNNEIFTRVTHQLVSGRLVVRENGPSRP